MCQISAIDRLKQLPLLVSLGQWFLTFFDGVTQCSFTKIIRADQLRIFHCVFNEILETAFGCPEEH